MSPQQCFLVFGGLTVHQIIVAHLFHARANPFLSMRANEPVFSENQRANEIKTLGNLAHRNMRA